MRKLLLLTTMVALAVPASASAVEYWGGPMGRDLPVANITYKVNDEGAVKGVQVQVRVKCHLAGGGPHPNSQLVTGFTSPHMTSSGFEATRKPIFDGGSQRIEAEVSGASAVGIFEAAFRIHDLRSDETEVCHTGTQPWKAKPVSFKKWKRLRDYS